MIIIFKLLNKCFYEFLINFWHRHKSFLQNHNGFTLLITSPICIPNDTINWHRFIKSFNEKKSFLNTWSWLFVVLYFFYLDCDNNTIMISILANNYSTLILPMNISLISRISFLVWWCRVSCMFRHCNVPLWQVCIGILWLLIFLIEL